MEDCVERLIAAGFGPMNAAQICTSYIANRDIDGLESFVCSCECYDPLKAKEDVNDGI